MRLITQKKPPAKPSAQLFPDQPSGLAFQCSFQAVSAGRYVLGVFTFRTWTSSARLCQLLASCMMNHEWYIPVIVINVKLSRENGHAKLECLIQTKTTTRLSV